MAGEPRRENEAVKPIEFDILLGRHSNRFGGKYEWKDPATAETLSGDDTQNLTPKGKTYAQEWGAANLADYNFVVGIGSMERRTAETIDDLKTGAQKERGLGPNRFFGITFSDMGENSAKAIDGARGIIKRAVGAFPNYGRLEAEERATLRQSAQEKGMNEAMKNPVLVDEFAEGLAYNLWAIREMAHMAAEAGSALQGNKIAVPMVSHGGFNESFLMRCLQVDGETGKLDSVEALGGYFKPAEFFKLKLTMQGGEEREECEFTDPGRKQLFAGKTLTIDWGKVKELFHKYEERMKYSDYQARLKKQMAALAKEN